jgi:uroporphyrinogen-III synthase
MERVDDLRRLRAKICCIGPATAEALRKYRVQADLMGKEYVAESLLAAFAEYDVMGKRILLARARVARDVIPEELTRRGAHVDVVEAYRTEAPEKIAVRMAEVLARRPDCITFTSSSTVRNFVDAVGTGVLEGVKVASIGPITSETARGLGIAVTVEAHPFTVDALVDAVLGLYTEVTPPSDE